VQGNGDILGELEIVLKGRKKKIDRMAVQQSSAAGCRQHYDVGGKIKYCIKKLPAGRKDGRAYGRTDNWPELLEGLEGGLGGNLGGDVFKGEVG
jgi:hypothetical protein